MSTSSRLSLFILLNFLITACTPLFTQDAHQAACQKLKADIVFNAATSNDRNAEIQRAQRPLQQHSYDQHCQ